VIAEDGPPEQLFTAPKEPRTRQFLQRLLEGAEGRGKK
jgi:ABC-type histidine transport system ATPase subunit